MELGGDLRRGVIPWGELASVPLVTPCLILSSFCSINIYIFFVLCSVLLVFKITRKYLSVNQYEHY